MNYQYDGTGRLVECQSSGTTDYYFYAGSQVVETRETTTRRALVGAGPVPVRLVGPQRRPDPPRHDQDQRPADRPFDRIYYLTDADDNVTAITNNAGDGPGAIRVFALRPSHVL